MEKMIHGNKIHVLIFPAGEVNAAELHDALCSCVNIEVYGASSEDRHGRFLFKNYKTGLPNISDGSFMQEFNRVLDEWQIDFIFPTHGTVAEYFASCRNMLHAGVICADSRTAHICRDKRLAYELFQGEGFCPEIYSGFDRLPVFMKPRRGQGAIGAKLINSRQDVPAGLDLNDYVICEYLPGEEYTVDCLTDRHGSLTAVMPRSRQRLLAGITVRGKDETLTEEIRRIASCINEKLGFLGLWYFQIKKDVHGKFKLLEVSARCAGSMCLSRALGVNLPLLSVYAACGRSIEVIQNPYHVMADRTLLSRYRIDYIYDRVYMDLDDTLIIQDKVCLPVIRFVYQCRNCGIPVCLLTRHNDSHHDSDTECLSRHAVSTDLFEQIISLGAGEEKPDYIKPEGSIFIDNSYQERKKVFDRHHIPVFDVEGMEVLADWRS